MKFIYRNNEINFIYRDVFRHVPCTKYEKKKKIRSFFFVPSETGNFSLKMHAWGGERSVAADVQPVQFPNLRPEANLVILRGQTSGPSKLDGFNRRLIIAWIFHRAIFLLNNIQREIQRSLLSSIRAYARIHSFQTFDRNCGDRPRLLGWNETKRANEIVRDRCFIAIKIEIFDLCYSRRFESKFRRFFNKNLRTMRYK